MRQKTQSSEDAAFRIMLEHLRMKSCTPEDIILMESRVPHVDHPNIDLNKKAFHHASIITSKNATRDRIIEKMALKFAGDTGRILSQFYSIDHK